VKETLVTMTRLYDAPRERVFAAWTQAEHFAEEVIDVRFIDREGSTELRLRATASGVRPEAAAMLDDMEQMWARTVSRLGKHLKPGS
jgi:hypothetical protein